MTYELRLDVLRLIEQMRAMHASEADCYCGRRYRLSFDGPSRELLDKVEAGVKAEPDVTRNQLIEIE